MTFLPDTFFSAFSLGVFTMCFASANMLGAPLGGWVLASSGGTYLWTGTLILGLLAAILFATIHRHIAFDGPSEKVRTES